MTDLEQFRQLLHTCGHMVFFGGAGVSTESGIPDFRSVDGLYHEAWHYPPEEILSHGFFEQKPAEFFRFYHKKMLRLDVLPNDAHRALAALEAQGKCSAIVTQNIDGLHQKAGSRNVLELHGSIHHNTCLACGKKHPAQELAFDSQGVARCSCGGIIKPDVVLYGEGLDERVVQQSVDAIRRADVLIVGGTSVSVYPAAGLLDYFHGDALVVLNRTPTPLDHRADLVLTDPIGQVFRNVMK